MEPLLENISTIIPDEKIDRELSFPCPDRGPHSDFKPSQLYRIHLLLPIKRLVSFRQVHEDMKHHKDWRSFARLKNKDQVPSLDVSSRFRKRASSLLRQINQLYIKTIFDIVGIPESVIAVPDSTDIEAATKGYQKKVRLP
jgi:transposase